VADTGAHEGVTMCAEGVSGSSGLSLTAIILTYDEELHIERCIRSLKPVASRVYVVDSFSTDATVEIARRLGADVVQRKFKNQADQFQWALDNLPVDTNWVMRVDADEYISTQLAASMRELIPRAPASVSGFYVDRLVVFLGRPIRHGGFYPMKVLKIWRTGLGQVEQRWIDEYCVVKHGLVEYCPGDLIDENLHDLTWWTDKHNKYSSRRVIDLLDRELKLGLSQHAVTGNMSGRQVIYHRIKTRVYPALPPYLRAFAYYLYRYVFRLGFLDGQQGLVFCFLQAFWNLFLVDAKLYEARRMIAAAGLESFIEHLRDAQGLNVGPLGNADHAGADRPHCPPVRHAISAGEETHGSKFESQV
jgi:glycosyltransferase involved in cell wall biosynthesis